MPQAEGPLAVALVGVGRMGLALWRGWAVDASLAVRGFDPEPSAEARALGAEAALTGATVQVLVLAVKPQVFAQAAPAARGLLAPGGLVLSVMAGVSCTRLAEAFGTDRIVRAMPNTPGAIGQGISGFALHAGAVGDMALARRLLAPLGAVEGPLPETQLDAVTGLSGSGPAYVFALVEALEAAGVAQGLAPDVAARLARQTVVGAGALLAVEAATPPEALRAAVTSPGGTTAAGLGVLLAQGGLPALISATVAAATARSRELV